MKDLAATDSHHGTFAPAARCKVQGA